MAKTLKNKDNVNPTAEDKEPKEQTKEYKNKIKNKKAIIKQYLREKDYAIKLRQTKIQNWIKNEELYNGVTQRTLLTRSNLHVPVVFEGVQNMSAKLGGAPELKFDTIPEGDENASELMEHVVKEDLRACYFDLIYEQAKIECGIYGRAIFKVIPGNDRQRVELVDTLAYLISPIAKNTGKAIYQGQQFIYKTIEEIEDEAERMEYDEESIQDLKDNKVPNETQVDQNSEASIKNIRQANMGLANVTQYGSKVIEITEWVTHIKGILTHLSVANDRYLLRAKPSKELGLKRPNYISFGTYPRGITFWCPSVADVYRDPNLAIDVSINQTVDNNTYRNFGMIYVASSSGLKQSSIIPRPLGVTSVQCTPEEKVQDKIFMPVIPEITSALQTMTTIKGFADSAAGLQLNLPSKGKINVTQQAKMQYELETKVLVMKLNATLACEELYQLMADITKDKMTKPREVKVFGYKNLTVADVTKDNFKDVKLVAKATPSENSQENKAIKQKAKMSLYQLFKDDPKIPGQTAMRRSVAKTFDISPDEIEAWFTEDKQPTGDNIAGMPPKDGAPADGNIPENGATPVINATKSASALNVPPAIK